MVTQANGTAEREASETMLKAQAKRARRRITVGEDKAYDTQDHVAALRNIGVTPHVAQNDAELWCLVTRGEISHGLILRPAP
jgi:hypothetical protein